MKINVPFSDDNPFMNYKVKQKLVLNEAGNLPLIYWPVTPNFGDLLSPWMFEKITGKKVDLVKTRTTKSEKKEKVLGLFKRKKMVIKISEQERAPNYISIGSIISRTRDSSEVWGTGSFGTEPSELFNKNAIYRSVRGPLTKQLLEYSDIKCPAVFGDPALLMPYLYNPQIEKTHEVGLVLRWSEKDWLQKSVGPGVRIIDLGESDIEKTMDEILSCKKIITSSLHGLIIADAYGLPNAWLGSESPKGGTFKYYDYFLSVDKVRHPNRFDVGAEDLTIENLNVKFNFDDKKIKFDYFKLLDACPLLDKN